MSEPRTAESIEALKIGRPRGYTDAQIADLVRVQPGTIVEAIPADRAEAINAALDALKAQTDACAPYLKDGETPAECIARNRKDIDALMALLAAEKRRSEAALKAQTWQGMETAPKDGTLILVYADDVMHEGLTPFVTVCAYHPNAGFCVDELRVPTHWMPLPAPPSDRTEGR